MRLRFATGEDAPQVLAWRNDPWIVSLSASGMPVDPAAHRDWFASMLASPGSHLLFIVEDPPGRGIGTVRLDRTEARAAEVTIYLLQPYTGAGRGVAALRQACGEAFRSWPELAAIRARIRAENEISRRAFAHAGFRVERAGGDGEPWIMCMEREAA